MFSQFFYSALKQSFSKKTSLLFFSTDRSSLPLYPFSQRKLHCSTEALLSLFCFSLSLTPKLYCFGFYILSLSLSLSLSLFSVLISEPKLFAGFLLWVRVSLIQPLRLISASIDLLVATDSKVSSLFR